MHTDIWYCLKVCRVQKKRTFSAYIFMILGDNLSHLAHGCSLKGVQNARDSNSALAIRVYFSPWSTRFSMDIILFYLLYPTVVVLDKSRVMREELISWTVTQTMLSEDPKKIYFNVTTMSLSYLHKMAIHFQFQYSLHFALKGYRLGPL